MSVSEGWVSGPDGHVIFASVELVPINHEPGYLVLASKGTSCGTTYNFKCLRCVRKGVDFERRASYALSKGFMLPMPATVLPPECFECAIFGRAS